MLCIQDKNESEETPEGIPCVPLSSYWKMPSAKIKSNKLPEMFKGFMFKNPFLCTLIINLPWIDTALAIIKIRSESSDNKLEVHRLSIYDIIAIVIITIIVFTEETLGPEWSQKLFEYDAL